MVKKYIYCEKKFFDLCMTKIANWNFCEANFEELKLWMCLKETIFANDIILHLDITDGELQLIRSKNNNDLTLFEKSIKNLIIHKQKVGAVIKKNDSFVNIDNIDTTNAKQLTAYYLTCCDSKKCEKYMNDYGVLAICPDNIKDFKSILYDNGTAIGKNEQVAKNILWKKYIKLNPCNSLILIDNYILQKKHYIYNLENIIDSILPKSLNNNVIFQIYVFTELKFFQKIKNFYDEIKILIRKIRPKLKFDLSLFKCNGYFHDRIIATNNVYISCGSGFNVLDFRREISRINFISTEMTVLNVLFPYFPTDIKWGTMAYKNLIKESFNFVNNCNEYQGKDDDYNFFIGSKQNRLIE